MNDEWPAVLLGELLTDLQPGFASGRHNAEGDGVPHFRPMNVSTEGRIERGVMKYVDPASRPDVRLLSGDVLFNNTNSPELVGKTAFFGDDDSPAFSNHMTRLRVDVERLNPRYAALRLHQAWREGWFAAHCNNHVSQASIGRDVLKGFEIELPPLDIQQAIVSLSVGVEASRRSASAHLAAASRAIQRFHQAVLISASSGRLTAEWRGAVDSAETPESWVTTTVGQIGDVQLGGTPSRKEASFWNGGIPWVSSGEVANCRIGDTRETISAEGLAGSSAKMYPPGTVLIAMIGEGKTRGQSAILDIEACTNQNAAGIIPDTKLVMPEYLWRWALAQYEITRAVGRGGNQPALNKQKVKDLIITLPPIEEQAEIVRRTEALLTVADQLVVRLDRAEHRVDRSSQAVLAKAFRGDLSLTVPEVAA